jgi:hypothetical protein
LVIEVSKVVGGVIEEIGFGLLKRASGSKMCVLGNECSKWGVRCLWPGKAGREQRLRDIRVKGGVWD